MDKPIIYYRKTFTPTSPKLFICKKLISMTQSNCYFMSICLDCMGTSGTSHCDFYSAKCNVKVYKKNVDRLRENLFTNRLKSLKQNAVGRKANEKLHLVH